MVSYLNSNSLSAASLLSEVNLNHSNYVSSMSISKSSLSMKRFRIFNTKEEGREGGNGEKSKGDQAKELLAKYGGAYLATSITLSIISFSLCYALISAGVDVPALLQKVGISTNETGEKVGTFALAYAAHKAASPIRFPPTVALTPIVASWIGKKVEKEN
ncbi:Protein FAM210A/B-like domain [Dillenia turbinata]|uniref:Protein FAM210A/B-like domain n=1 Tax=Dillenia turbinata TaxID=194707 RepID=A0AAN8VC17_9MAGN